MTATRRKFLALVGMTPIAAPVAAKQAAVAMGLSGPIGGAGDRVGGPMLSGHGPIPVGPNDWAINALKRLASEDGQREIMQDAKAYARTLDPDLAALRSVSPAFAFRRQRDRNEVEIMNHRRASYLRDIAENAKMGIFK